MQYAIEEKKDVAARFRERFAGHDMRLLSDTKQAAPQIIDQQSIPLVVNVMRIVLGYIDDISTLMHFPESCVIAHLESIFRKNYVERAIMLWPHSVPQSMQEYARILRCRECDKFVEYTTIEGLCTSCSCISGREDSCMWCSERPVFMHNVVYRGERFMICHGCLRCCDNPCILYENMCYICLEPRYVTVHVGLRMHTIKVAVCRKHTDKPSELSNDMVIST